MCVFFLRWLLIQVTKQQPNKENWFYAYWAYTRRHLSILYLYLIEIKCRLNWKYSRDRCVIIRYNPIDTGPSFYQSSFLRFFNFAMPSFLFLSFCEPPNNFTHIQDTILANYYPFERTKKKYDKNTAIVSWKVKQ